MVRTQVQLTEEQARKVRALAASEGASMAEIIRRSMDQYAQHASRQNLPDDWEERRRRALAIVGKYASGVHDISEHHDRYLTEIYAEVADEE